MLCGLTGGAKEHSSSKQLDQTWVTKLGSNRYSRQITGMESEDGGEDRGECSTHRERSLEVTLW